MSVRPSHLIVGVTLVVLFVSACNLFTAVSPTPSEPGVLYTQAAQTVVAQLTQAAAGVLPTSTQTPTETSPPPTEAPTATPPPTNTLLPPTPTPVPPTPTPIPIPCNWARFIEDVTVKDGTVFTPNTNFTKTWRLKNIGTCTWGRDYDLVFDSGDRMRGSRAVDIPETVRPGETVDISVDLITPEEEGRYRGYWLLQSGSGNLFGVGNDAKTPFWVEVRVIASSDFVFDLGATYCAARWTSDAGRLDCPGKPGDEDGFVILVDKPALESGRVENEPALWTQPARTNNGFIRGEYPEIKVEQGHRFRSVVGCLRDAPRCDVVFQLNYRIGDGNIQTLWEQQEVYDGNFTSVNVDLSSLAGERVKFILTVLANGSPREDAAFWLVPRIIELEVK